MNAKDVMKALHAHGSAKDALFLQRFFKTGAGQYGEGDKFIGVRVPMTRKVCSQFRDLALPEVQKLLDSKVHEHRLAGVIILANQYPKVSEVSKQAIYDLYLKNVYGGQINNWDIIDVTAEHVVGAHLEHKPRHVLFELAKSDDVWQKRVAILSTFYFIKHGESETTIKIAEILLHDKHDLIQKAVGWLLREVGKRIDEKLLTKFLEQNAKKMPRTMLRYSVERLSPQQRTYFMGLK